MICPNSWLICHKLWWSNISVPWRSMFFFNIVIRSIFFLLHTVLYDQGHPLSLDVTLLALVQTLFFPSLSVIPNFCFFKQSHTINPELKHNSKYTVASTLLFLSYSETKQVSMLSWKRNIYIFTALNHWKNPLQSKNVPRKQLNLEIYSMQFSFSHSRSKYFHFCLYSVIISFSIEIILKSSVTLWSTLSASPFIFSRGEGRELSLYTAPHWHEAGVGCDSARK